MSDYMDQLTSGTKRELLRNLDAAPDSPHFQTVLAAIRVRSVEDIESALDRHAQALVESAAASEGLMRTLNRLTAGILFATVAGVAVALVVGFWA